MAVADLLESQTKELFLEKIPESHYAPGINPAISITQTEKILKEVAEETNVIPIDNGLGVDYRDIDNEPIYKGDYASLLRKYVKPAVDKMITYFSKSDRAVPYFGNLKIKAEHLPTYWGIFIKKTRDGFEFVPKIIAKVFGRYSQLKNEIALDPVILDPEDPKRNYMPTPPMSASKVASHELYHAVQNIAKTLSRYPKPIVEAEAEKASSMIQREQPVAYRRERKVYEEYFGNRLVTSLRNLAEGVNKWYINPIKASLTPGLSPLQPVPAYAGGRRT